MNNNNSFFFRIPIKLVCLFFLCTSYISNSQSLITPTISASGSTSLCTGQTVTLNTPAQTGASYQWVKDPIWQNVGTPGFSTGSVDFIKTAIANDGTTYIVYSDASNAGKVTVKKYSGTNWILIGTLSSSSPSLSNDIAIDANGIPYVAYMEGRVLNVKKFNGTAWADVGGPGVLSPNSLDMTINFSTTNELYIAFGDYSNSLNYGIATVMKFNGTTWIKVGSLSTSTSYGNTRNFSLAFSKSGTIYVSYRSSYNANTPIVEKFDGLTWSNISFPGYVTSDDLGLAIDENNVLYMVYRIYQGYASDGLIVKKLNGTNWEIVGNGVFASNGIGSCISIDGAGKLYVAFTEYTNQSIGNLVVNRGVVMKFDGTSWNRVGTQPLVGIQNDRNISLALYRDGVPFIAYPDPTLNGKISCSKYDGMNVGTNAINYNTNTIGCYNVKVSKNGKGALSTNCVPVTVNPKPTVSATSTMTTGCIFNLAATGASTYTWSPASGLNATSGATVTSSAKQNIVYTVTGTAANGCTNTFNVTTIVAPINITPPSAKFCSGNFVTLQAVGGSNCTWLPTTGLTPSTGPAVTARPTGTTSYTVSGTDANGCTTKGNLTITVDPLPTFAFTPSAPSVCRGSSVSIKASNDVGINYVWSPATALDNPGLQTVAANPTQTTQYFVSATNPVTGCSNAAAVIVNVIGVIAPVSTTICAGASTTLTASGATSYTWSPATGLNQTTGPSVIASPGSNQVYSVIGTTSCSSNPPQFVSVNVTPLPTIDLTPPSVTLPSFSSATLTASGSDNYTWSPASYLNTTTGTTVIATPPATFTYTVSSTANNCTANKNITVTVIPAPIGANMSNPIQFRVDPIPLGTTYTDTRNNNPVNNFWNDYGQPSDDIFYKFTISQSSRVKLQHCNTSTTGISDSYMHLLDINNKLTNSNDDIGPLCSTSLRSSMDLGLSAGTYFVISEGFSNNSGDIKTDLEVLPCLSAQVGSTMTNPIIISTNIGSCFTYISPLISNGCMGNEYGQPSEDIYYKFTLNSPQKVNLTSCGSTFYDTYLTLLNSDGSYRTSNDDYGPFCSADRRASISIDLPAGTYYVVLEGYSNFCGVMSVNLTTPTTTCPNLREESASENSGPSKAELAEMANFVKTLNVYPNPSVGEMIVDLNVSTDATVVLVDMFGKVVAEKQVISGSNSFKFDGSNLPKGIYIVKVLGTELSKSVLIK